jgi:hypothetical protein
MMKVTQTIKACAPQATSRFRFRLAMAAGVLALLAGCQTSGGPPGAGAGPAGSGRAPVVPTYYQAVLSGREEVPPNPATASGSAEFQYDPASQMLSWRVVWRGLTGLVTGMHLHGPAQPGQNVGVVVPFDGDLNRPPLTGRATLNQAQFDDLHAGRWYLNIHTEMYPGGEIRGQVRRR